MPSLITSLSNPKVKDAIKLRESSERKKTGLTLIEGEKEVLNAIAAKVDIKEFLICRDVASSKLLEKINKSNKPVTQMSKNVFEKISYGDRLEGVVAIAKPQLNTFSDLLKSAQPFLLIVESVEKPGNLGAILRSADGSGVDGIIVCEKKTDIFNPNVIRASLGTIFTVKTVQSSNEETFQFLKTNGIRTFAGTPQTNVLHTQANYKGAIAIVVGSEDKGLSSFWLDKADVKIKIPMKGQADSLNVSTSTAILLYEALRQRGN